MCRRPDSLRIVLHGLPAILVKVIALDDLLHVSFCMASEMGRQAWPRRMIYWHKLALRSLEGLQASSLECNTEVYF